MAGQIPGQPVNPISKITKLSHCFIGSLGAALSNSLVCPSGVRIKASYDRARPAVLKPLKIGSPGEITRRGRASPLGCARGRPAGAQRRGAALSNSLVCPSGVRIKASYDPYRPAVLKPLKIGSPAEIRTPDQRINREADPEPVGPVRSESKT